MKRYWLFFGSTYYPLGGMSDFSGSFDTQEEALTQAKARGTQANTIWGSPDYWWSHILDSQTGDVLNVKDLACLCDGGNSR